MAANTPRMAYRRRDVASLLDRSRQVLMRGGGEVDRALLELHAVREMQEFWQATRRVLHAALPLHFICMCLRPFALLPSTVFRECAPFSSESEFKLFQEINPIQPHLAEHPGITLVRLSDVVVDAELVKTAFYLRFMEPHADRYFACLNFWHGGLFQGLIGLHRTPEQRDFGDSECAMLEQLHEHFETVLQRILSLHRERAVRLSLEKLLGNLPIATVLLDWELRIACRNRSAVELCAHWNLGPTRATQEKYSDDFELPRAVLACCRDFKTSWNPCSHRECPLTSAGGVLVECEGQPGLRASINLLQLDAAPLSMPMFLVRFEDRRGVDDVDEFKPSAVGPLARLSPREREVALLVSRGCGNEEVAARLGKSALTVKKQLRSIYRKLDVANRGRLMALMR